jgi:UDP-N-acetyl-D-galactosamine dehydrogenase
VIDVVRELQSYGVNVHVHDPIASPGEALHEYGVRLEPWDELPRAEAVIAAVAHNAFRAAGAPEMTSKLVPGGVVADVKCQFDAELLRSRGYVVWRL